MAVYRQVIAKGQKDRAPTVHPMCDPLSVFSIGTACFLSAQSVWLGSYDVADLIHLIDD